MEALAAPYLALDAARVSRTGLVASDVALVEDLTSLGVDAPRTECFSPRFQVCLPYRGVFVWHVGGEDVLGDPNQLLFVAGGESFRMSQPAHHGYGELIVTPSARVLADLLEDEPGRWHADAAFRSRSRRVDPTLQHAAAQLRLGAACGRFEMLDLEERVLDLLRRALRPVRRHQPVGAATRRLVTRAKAYLNAHGTEPLRLSAIARAVGASAAYLTDAFRRVEGVPLHRYLVQLRLARALVELPHAGDLSALAIGLGFSSHSHFSAAFRGAYGCTPSAFRRSVR